MPRHIMGVELDISDDWNRVLHELKYADRKWYYKFNARVARPAKAAAAQVAASVPKQPLSGLPVASPQSYARIRRPQWGGNVKPRSLVTLGVTQLGWVQAADLVQVEGRFKTAVDSKYGSAGSSRWVLPLIDQVQVGLLAEIRRAIVLAWDDLGWQVAKRGH